MKPYIASHCGQLVDKSFTEANNGCEQMELHSRGSMIVKMILMMIQSGFFLVVNSSCTRILPPFVTLATVHPRLKLERRATLCRVERSMHHALCTTVM